jgi:very-short-patch-repair endonuclease
MADPSHLSHVRHGKGATRSLDRWLGDLAERQHGLVARRQLLARGMGRGAIEDRIARGRLRPVQRGVYAVGHARTDQKARWMSVVLAAGPGAVLSHRSAAALWGLLPPFALEPEVTRPIRTRSRPGLKIHQAPLEHDEVSVVDGIPVTSLSRTLLDLAARVSRQHLEQAFNEVEVRRLTDRLSVLDLLKRRPRRQGARALRSILMTDARSRGVTRKELEARFGALLAQTDLPQPRRNVHVAVSGRFFEVDCLWADERLIVELDGRAAHGTKRAFERDRERDRLLVAEGWRVVRVTWRQLMEDAPAVIADLRRSLRHRPWPPTL